MITSNAMGSRWGEIRNTNDVLDFEYLNFDIVSDSNIYVRVLLFHFPIFRSFTGIAGLPW